jgi:cell division protease FtsH
MGGPMDFGRNKSKFQEVPETGITFDDVAASSGLLFLLNVDFIATVLYGLRGPSIVWV